MIKHRSGFLRVLATLAGMSILLVMFGMLYQTSQHGIEHVMEGFLFHVSAIAAVVFSFLWLFFFVAKKNKPPR